MSEVAEFKVLSAEELGALVGDPDKLMAYSRAYQAHMAGKKSAEARQALQDSIRSSLKFPVLTADTVKAVVAAGATGFVVIYSLTGEDAGHGTPSAVYPAAGKTRTAKAKADGAPEAAVIQRPLGANYAEHTTEEMRAADNIEISRRAKERMANHPDITEKKALGDAQWKVRVERLHKLGVAGYEKGTPGAS